jgi:ABC-2 type transport system ATP-binding protein
MTCIMRAVGIDKWRGKQRVLRGITVDVHSGEILAILGPNGAGKSTLMTILAGLLRPDAGTIQFYGEDLAQMGARVRARLGMALQNPGLSPRLTVRETLTFFSTCYNGDRPVADLLARFRLTEVQQRQIRRLSAGQQQRVAMALAFVKRFDVILLDEPMAGLDPEGRATVWSEIHAARARGAAVICATHLTDEAQQQSDRILLLYAGTQVALARPSDILARLPGQEKIDIVVTPGLRVEHLAALPGVTAICANERAVTLYCQRVRHILPALLADDGLSHISYGAVTLDDVFRLLTRDHGRIGQ